MIQPEREITCAGRAALGAFRARVMADEALTSALCDIEDAEQFTASALRLAATCGLALDEAEIRRAIQPDPLNIARFTARPPDGTQWPPRQWLPVHVATLGDHSFVDWAHFGSAPRTDPFFEGSARGAARRPFSRMFRYRMTLADFTADAPRHRSLRPTGFIFHMSRCGSTLVAQMLAAVSRNIVVSEAAPIDTIVQLGSAWQLEPQAHAGLLAAMIAAFGRQRSGRESGYFIKLDCWHALALPLFERAFPATPWLFLYRDPIEVLVSHVRQRGSQMVPELTPAQLYGLDDFNGPPNEDSCARVLAAICRAAAGRLGDGKGRGIAVNYRALPDAVRSRILPHFAVATTADDDATMTRAALQDAKAPQFAFAGDSDGKQRDASPALRALAESHLADVFARLEALKRA